MSQKLFEANFITINTSAWDRPVNASRAQTEPTGETQGNGATTKNINTDEYPPKATDSKSWTAWGEWLETRLKDNNDLDKEAKMSSIEITNEFFENFFVTNWGQDVGTKLNAFNNIRKYFIRNNKVNLASFTPETSPLLKFLTKDFTTKLITDNKFKSGTFNTILLAYKDALVEASVFAGDIKEVGKYNILYCLDLYEKSPTDMLAYLKLQKSVLEAGNAVKNKLTFLKSNAFTSSEPEERAKEIKDQIKTGKLPGDLPSESETLETCKLNNLDLVKLIADSDHTIPATLNSAGQDTVIAKLPTLEDKFAAIFALSLTTSSADAKQALKDSRFSGLSAEDRLAAATKLASSDILPKGQIKKSDADALVAKIISSISKDSTK